MHDPVEVGMVRSAVVTALTWLDVIVTIMLVFAGSATWHMADHIVTSAWLTHAPNKDAFLLSDDVKGRELKVESLKAELTATRTKAVEQAFVDKDAAAPYRERVSHLEREVVLAEREALDARQAAVDRFEDVDLGFTVRRRLATFPVAIGLAVVAFFLLRALASGIGGLEIHWGFAARIAACVVVPLYGFEVAGALGAVLGAATALLILVRP
jgi:hypothetical protein